MKGLLTSENGGGRRLAKIAGDISARDYDTVAVIPFIHLDIQDHAGYNVAGRVDTE